MFALVALMTISYDTARADQPGSSPVKVFILAGQSNMVGQGLVPLIPERNEGRGSLEYLFGNPETASRFAHTVDENGEWSTRTDVWITYGDKELRGDLTVGYGGRDDKIGPEYQFGHIVGTALDEQVLLIKTCWGGKSLAFDFRPPSAGEIPYELSERTQERLAAGEVSVGGYYRDMLAEVDEVLENLDDYFPGYDGQGYEIAGFCWHQGWNDGCDENYAPEYSRNMPLFIDDVREALGDESLPFVIANSGFGGPEPRGGVVGRLQESVQPGQAAAAEAREGVVCIDTREFYRAPEVSPGSGDIEHWYSNAESYFLIGDALGREMLDLLEDRE